MAEKIKENKYRILLIISGVIIVALVVCMVFLLQKNRRNVVQSPDEQIASRGVVANNDNIEEIISQVEESNTDPGYYTANMTNEWHFPSGTDVSKDAYVSNLPENSNSIYFDVVMAEDESHVIYRSPVIPLGQELTDIKLDEDLDKGDYKCVLIYYLIDENNKVLSTLRISISVIVES